MTAGQQWVESWRKPHSDSCTPEMRRKGMYAADCEQCDAWVRWLAWIVRGEQ